MRPHFLIGCRRLACVCFLPLSICLPAEDLLATNWAEVGVRWPQRSTNIYVGVDEGVRRQSRNSHRVALAEPKPESETEAKAKAEAGTEVAETNMDPESESEPESEEAETEPEAKATATKYKVALLFRGESFRSPTWPKGMPNKRKQWGAHKRRTCEDDSMNQQQRFTALHQKHIYKMVKLGIDVDVFGVTYDCGNGLDYASRLPEMYAPHMRKFEVLPKRGSLQVTTMAHILRTALKSGKEYDGIYMLRWDYEYVSFSHLKEPECFVDSMPRNMQYFEYHSKDALVYIPGSYAKQMLAFMDLDNSTCCRLKCGQDCNRCVDQFLTYMEMEDDGMRCSPCLEAHPHCDRFNLPASLEARPFDESMDVDGAWCKDYQSLKKVEGVDEAHDDGV